MNIVIIGIPFLVIFIILGLLYFLQKKYVSFTWRTLTALSLGLIAGAGLQVFNLNFPLEFAAALEFLTLLGDIYLRLLRMIVMPVVLVSILCAFVNIDDPQSLRKPAFFVIGILLVTTVLAGLTGVFVSKQFNLENFPLLTNSTGNSTAITEKLQTITDMSLAERLVTMIPTNPFQDLAGLRSNSVISVVIFLTFIGIAFLKIRNKKPEKVAAFKNLINALHDIIMKVVALVLRFTPYGIFAIITRVVVVSQWQEILQLFNFVAAIYVALFIVYVWQILILVMAGLNPFTFMKKTFSLMTFAFVSRSSSAAIPVSIETQSNRLGIPEGIAGLSATFGSVLGQNGCSGVYPAMLAVIVAPWVGIDPFSFSFLATLSLVLAVSSLGVAGVGGGAIFSSLIVLSTMGLPVEIVGVLLSIDPIIDMGRTLVNVNGAVVASTVASRIEKKLDMKTYNEPTKSES